MCRPADLRLSVCLHALWRRNQQCRAPNWQSFSCPHREPPARRARAPCRLLRRTSRHRRVPPPRLTHQPWSDGRFSRCRGFSPAQVSLLRRCAERREREVFLLPAAAFSPFLQQFFPPPLALSSFPQALSFFPEAFQPSLPRGLSFPPVAALNHRLSQPLPRSSPPGLRALSFRAGQLFLRSSRLKPFRSRA